MYVNWLVFKEAGEAYERFFHAQGMQLRLFTRRFKLAFRANSKEQLGNIPS